MKVEQIYNLINDITKENLGESVVVNEDLSNIVDLGKQFDDAIGYDNFTKQLVDKVGRMIFVDRVYGGRAPSVLIDGWEYGSILQKVSTVLPEAQENDIWNLQDGESYDPNVFKQPEVVNKFFNDRVTFDIQLSITTDQMKSAFNSATEMNSFVSMLYTAVSNSMTVKTDALIMRTINNMIGETLYSEFTGGTYTGDSGIRAVNLLYLYNVATYGASTGSYIDAATFMKTPEALRFAAYTFRNYVDRLKVMSTLFNVGGQERFTPADRMKLVMLSEFYNAASVYLYDANGQFLTDSLKYPDAETVTYWQGSGTSYGFSSTSAVKITTSGGHSINASGILGVMFDRDALGVTNIDQKVTTQYNPKADFTNTFYHRTQGMFNDLNENFVVFYVA